MSRARPSLAFAVAFTLASSAVGCSDEPSTTPGPADASVPRVDADSGDLGPGDVGPGDVGATDAGAADAEADAGGADAGPVDGGPADTGVTDAGPTDAAAGVDGGPTDAGTSGVPGVYRVDPAALDFGQVVVGTIVARNVFITNLGGTVFLFDDALDSSGSGFAADVDRTTIPPGEAAVLSVRFAPSQAGTFTATVTLTPLDGSVARTTIPLRGEGVTSRLLVQPTSVDFGLVRVGTTARSTVTVENPTSGGASVELLLAPLVEVCPPISAPMCVALSGGRFDPGPSFSVGAGATVTLEVELTPTVAGMRVFGDFLLRDCPSPMCETGVSLTGLGTN